ncbi:hypothetical protein [Marinoscillum sp. MHG1-6]|uniref:hypothetical protein n=1 Tax=Marinoscillum sp. MHG1-6 TaxID=2959627 RepID=UPI00215761AC|nr:hypothetical protein [Marinoscillum sp. MHG1-6]
MKNLLLIIFILGFTIQLHAQNSMGIGTNTPNPNAVLDLVSPTNNQGLLVPRLTTAQRTAMSLTATENGLMVFDSDEGIYYFWVSGAWQPVANGASSPWSTQSGNLFYNGKVAVNSDTVKSDFQVGSDLHFFHFENAGFQINGEVVGDNIFASGDQLFTSSNGPSAFMFLDSGDIEFVHGPPLNAGDNALQAGLESSLRLYNSRDAEFKGSLRISSLRDSTILTDGTLSYNGDLFIYSQGQWKPLGGLTFPYQANINDGSGSPFYIENNGSGGVAEFRVSNTSAFGSPLTLYSNSQQSGANAMNITHDGNGIGLNLHMNSASTSSDALFVQNNGLGTTGYFRSDNSGSLNPTLHAEMISGSGNAIEGYNRGLGPAGRFTADNASNGSVAFIVDSYGTNSAATFRKFNVSVSPAVEIDNTSGGGAGLTIQNPSGTTSFGDVSFITGNLGLGEFSPSAVLDVVGTTELNGSVTVVGNPIAADGFTYNAGQIRYTTIGVHAFQPEILTGDDPTTYVIHGNGTTAQPVNNGDPDAHLSAPVNLPNGAKLTRMEAQLYNASSIYGVTMELYRKTLGGAPDLIATCTWTGTLPSSTLNTTTVFNGKETIDNTTYQYWLRFTGSVPDGGAGLESYTAGVRFQYTVAEPD